MMIVPSRAWATKIILQGAEVRVETQPAYVLHRRSYRDTSLLLELWTPDYGRVSAVARGARKPGRRSQQVYLEAFVPLLVSWTGKSALKTLTARESRRQGAVLAAQRLYSAIYINELLIRLLPHEDPHPDLYEHYEALLQELAVNDDLEPALRGFELLLLDEIGYGIELSIDAERGEPVEHDVTYCYVPEIGIVRSRREYDVYPQIKGSSLQSMSKGTYDAETRRTAKKLLRQALALQLGDKPLNSRDLFG